MIPNAQDTIAAIATPQGKGAIAIVRLSGPMAISIVNTFFSGADLLKAKRNTVHFGTIKDGNTIIDECLISLFRAPKSYTKENIIEISCHASPFITKQIICLCLSKGARLAKPGEFTKRAYLNGQLDLSQAEAVADVIASQSAVQHALAMNQMRGAFSKEIQEIRNQLIHFASMIELENDFGEEDVTFADRDQLLNLIDNTQLRIQRLTDSFSLGNVIKEGIPTAIIGPPNAGKSTLLNAILGEEKAIVSDIPGTTRDVIEDKIQINGIDFRFMDTAGIRETQDAIEAIGVDRSYEKLKKAKIILYLHEISEDYQSILKAFRELPISESQISIILLNKQDTFHTCSSYEIEEAVSTSLDRMKVIALSAVNKSDVENIKDYLFEVASELIDLSGEHVILSNVRHLEALNNTKQYLFKVAEGIKNDIPTDFLALDLKHAQFHLGEISGQISNDEILGSIFSNFCIGK